MFATDFLFDRQHASDFGLMICSFDGSPEAASGGEIEYDVIQTPGRDRFTFYGIQSNPVIEWHFSICKDPDQNTDLYFTQYEESRIAKWLLQRDGYRLFQFCQEGYEDIFYYAFINMQPHQILGQTAGFDLTVTSDCAYGFTGILRQKATLSASSRPLEFRLQSDVNTYILPRITIKCTGNFIIRNENDPNHPETEFKNLEAGRTWEFIMDTDADTVFLKDGENFVPITDPSMFNWHFLRLKDGTNRIIAQAEPGIIIETEIQYREPRRVIL